MFRGARRTGAAMVILYAAYVKRVPTYVTCGRVERGRDPDRSVDKIRVQEPRRTLFGASHIRANSTADSS